MIDPTLILSEKTSKIVRLTCDKISLVSFCSGVKSGATHLAETFDTPNSFCRIFSTRPWDPIHHDSVHMSNVYLSCCCCESSTPVIFEALFVHLKFGWLVDLGLWPFETVFQSLSDRLPKRGRKKREKIDEGKNVQTTPTRTYCKHNRPLPYYHPN